MKEKNLKRILLFFSFIIPFFIFLIYNLNHFYDHGGYTLDDGWFAYLATNSTTFPMQNPIMIGGTFFSVHIAPFFYILTFLYTMLNGFISEVTFFSIYLAVINALLSYAIFNISLTFINFKKNIQVITIFFIAILTSFNGVVLSAIGFPHIELAIPILIILFISLNFTNQKKVSYLVLLFLLLIREDAGFHLFAILFLLSVAIYIISKDKNTAVYILKIALIGFVYSLIAILIQKMYFPSTTLERVYLGSPHFAHLTKDFLMDRIYFLQHNKEYLYIPLIATLFFSFLYKNIFLSLSILAIIPWVILSFIAISYQAGGLHSYYSFPFILLVSWPSIAFALTFKYSTDKKKSFISYIVTVIFITVSSIFLFPNNLGSHDSSPWKTIGFNFIQNMKNTDQFIQYISKNNNGLYVDDHIGSLMTQSLIPNETWMGFNIKVSNYLNKKVQTIAFYNNKYSEPIKHVCLEKNLKHIYYVPNSNILLASQKKLSETSYLKTYEKPLLFWNGASLPSNIGEKVNNYIITQTDAKPGYLTYGPYIKLPYGKYEFKIEYIGKGLNSIVLGKWDVGHAIPTGMQEYTHGTIYGTNNSTSFIEGNFTVPMDYSNERIEIRNHYNGTGDLTIKSLTITRVQ